MKLFEHPNTKRGFTLFLVFGGLAMKERTLEVEKVLSNLIDVRS